MLVTGGGEDITPAKPIDCFLIVRIEVKGPLQGQQETGSSVIWPGDIFIIPLGIEVGG